MNREPGEDTKEASTAINISVVSTGAVLNGKVGWWEPRYRWEGEREETDNVWWEVKKVWRRFQCVWFLVYCMCLSLDVNMLVSWWMHQICDSVSKFGTQSPACLDYCKKIKLGILTSLSQNLRHELCLKMAVSFHFPLVYFNYLWMAEGDICSICHQKVTYKPPCPSYLCNLFSTLSVQNTFLSVCSFKWGFSNKCYNTWLTPSIMCCF